MLQFGFKLKFTAVWNYYVVKGFILFLPRSVRGGEGGAGRGGAGAEAGCQLPPPPRRSCSGRDSGGPWRAEHLSYRGHIGRTTSQWSRDIRDTRDMWHWVGV